MLHARHPLVSSLMWSLGMVAPIVLAGFLLPVLYPLDTFNTIVIPFCLWILPLLFFLCASRDLYEHITGHRPSLMRYDHNTGYHINKHEVFNLLELYASLAISIGFFLGLLRFLEPPYLLASVLFCLCALIYVAIRLNYQLQPAHEERAANEQKKAADEARKAYEATLKPQTPPDLVPLLTLATQQLTNQKYVIIGTAAHSVPIYYRDDERMRHTAIMGSTGSGKTTAMCNLGGQDIYYGNALTILGAEKDLFDRLLPFIPEERMDDLIYFDAADTTQPVIGFNPFTLGKDEDVEKKIGETRTILKRAMGGELGRTMEPVIDNVVPVLVHHPHATFKDLLRLIDPADKTFRTAVKNDRTIDEETCNFWKRYDEDSYYKQYHSSLRNRFYPFTLSPLSIILAAPSFSFKTVLHSGHNIIFFDLSGLYDTALVTMGQMILATIEQTLLSRNPIDKEDRIPHYLYIDEFQKYAEDSEKTLKALFEGARKFNLGITLAHPSNADIPPKLLQIIDDNTLTTIALNLASQKSAAHFAGKLRIKKAGRDTFDPEALQDLHRGNGYVQTPTVKIGEKIAISTDPPTPLPPFISSDSKKARSKQNFGTEPPTEPVLRDQPDQPDQPNPPPAQKKKSFGITFE